MYLERGGDYLAVGTHVFTHVPLTPNPRGCSFGGSGCCSCRVCVCVSGVLFSVGVCVCDLLIF